MAWINSKSLTPLNVTSLVTIPFQWAWQIADGMRIFLVKYFNNCKIEWEMFNICAKPAQYLSGQLKNSYLATSLLCTLLQGIVNQFNSDLANFIITTLQAMALGQYWSEEDETFFLGSGHMYVLEVSGDFESATCPRVHVARHVSKWKSPWTPSAYRFWEST